MRINIIALSFDPPSSGHPDRRSSSSPIAASILAHANKPSIVARSVTGFVERSSGSINVSGLLVWKNQAPLIHPRQFADLYKSLTELNEQLILISQLDEDEKNALVKIINSMLTRKK